MLVQHRSGRALGARSGHGWPLQCAWTRICVVWKASMSCFIVGALDLEGFLVYGCGKVCVVRFLRRKVSNPYNCTYMCKLSVCSLCVCRFYTVSPVACGPLPPPIHRRLLTLPRSIQSSYLAPPPPSTARYHSCKGAFAIPPHSHIGAPEHHPPCPCPHHPVLSN